MSTPAAALLHNLTRLSTLLPSVRDADVEAIHDARIATRRIRAMFDIIGRDRRHEDLDGVAPVVRRLGRALGGVRDVDVQLELVRCVESRIPRAASALADVRRDLWRRRGRRARKLVKTLERIEWQDLEPIRRQLTGVARPSHRREAGDAVRAQASQLAGAVAHASGVYFPDRAHAVRIAIKKLRYVTEAAPLSRRRARRALKVLKRTQKTLGLLHDRQVLLDALEGHEGDAGAVEALADWLSADCRELFDEYRQQRGTLLLVARDLERGGAALAAATPIRRVLAVAVAAAPAMLLHSYGRHEHAHRPGGVEADLSVEGTGAGDAHAQGRGPAPTTVAS